MLFIRENHLIYKDVESSGKSVIETLLFNLEMLVYFFFSFLLRNSFSFHTILNQSQNQKMKISI